MREPNLEDVGLYRPDGKEMTTDDWNSPISHCLGVLLTGSAIDELDERGNIIQDDTILVLFNSGTEIYFTLPVAEAESGKWELIFDTNSELGKPVVQTLSPGDNYKLASRSMCLFRTGGLKRP